MRIRLRYSICLLALLATSALLTPAVAQEKQKPLPLEPARSLSMDLSEGTWMSADVSPDGETVVFDLMGDLFTVPMAGGDATQVTRGMAYDAQPKFSPDGAWLVFTSDRDGGQNIWTMRVDGSDTVQISTGPTNRAESPEWTPDGQYVVASMGAFRGRGLPKLHLYHKDGGTGTKLIDEPDNLKTLGAAFGGDDRWVWYAARTGDWDYNAQFPQYQLAVYDRETGESFTRTSRYGSAFRPTLSPDGRWLVYGTRFEDQTGLMLRDLDSGDERWLAYPVQRDDQESRAPLDVLPGMSFTPDSKELVASWGGRLWRTPIEGGDAVPIEFRARFDMPVGPIVDFDYPIEDTERFTVRQIRDAVPSPDGSRIVFSAMDRLWSADHDGTNAQRLTDQDASEHFPSWSPDGAWIAYASWQGAQGHLNKVASSGGDSQRLTTNGGVYAQSAWSPDGTRIVAARGTARAFEEGSDAQALSRALEELVWMPSEGGAETPIMPLGNRSMPHFRVDEPGRIYLSRADGYLVSVRWDGTDEKEHVRVRGETPAGSEEPASADLVIMAPRGDQALAQVERHLYTVTIPKVGGDTPSISVSNPDRAAFPARKLTTMGGEFPAWGADARTVHWSLGNAHFTYDLSASDAFYEAAEAEAEPSGNDDENADEDENDKPRFEPMESRIPIEVERDIPRGVAVLTGARIVTMEGSEVIEDGVIVVRDNRIEAVGHRGEVTVPEGAEVIDVTGNTIVPGFVDTHSHMRPTWGLHRNDQWMYLANLAYGVTTTRDPQTATTDVLSYSDLVRAGEIVGPRIYSTGPGVFWQDNISSLEEARDVMRNYSDYFDTKTLKMYVAGNRQQRQWIIQAARELEIMPTTEGSLNFKQDITETVDGYSGLEHSLPIYPIFGDVVELFTQMKRTYTPTLLVSYGGPWAENYFLENENPHDDKKLRRFIPHEAVDYMTRRRSQWFLPEEYVFEDHARFVADLVAAGGRAGIGSHGGGDLRLQGIGYHWELWAMQSGGLSPHDALAVATRHGAEAIGLDQDLGSLAVGKLADLIVLRSNPLEDIRNTSTIRYVMMNGRLFEADSLDEIYPRRRAQEPLWWWDRDPDAARLPGIVGTGGSR
jgi:Tol biopolymer transport system component/imidazolonepropionase-like amidohydrolase